MNLMDELKLEYGFDTPIFVSDVKKKGMSDMVTRQVLSRLVKAGQLERYAQGIYYIAQPTPFGKSQLNPKKVYEKKYISDGDQIYGYYSGLKLENALGLTTQMPNIIEIVTNNESSRGREVEIGGQQVRLCRSNVKITKNNAKTLQFLDLMKRKPWKSYSQSEQKRIIDFVRDQKIKNEDIYELISYFPSRVARNILESRVIDLRTE